MRTIQDIRRDIRACYNTAAVGHEMRSRRIEDHYIREAEAYERELELRRTGRILTGV